MGKTASKQLEHMRNMRNIGIIADSRYVITGEYGEGSMNTCLYSGQKNFVELYKRMLANEIELLAIKEEQESLRCGA